MIPRFAPKWSTESPRTFIPAPDQTSPGVSGFPRRPSFIYHVSSHASLVSIRPVALESTRLLCFSILLSRTPMSFDPKRVYLGITNQKKIKIKKYIHSHPSLSFSHTQQYHSRRNRQPRDSTSCSCSCPCPVPEPEPDPKALCLV